MYITDTSRDPAAVFEDLARFAFDNCKKKGDPWGYAGQEVYSNFVNGIELEGKRILSTILITLINKYKATDIVDSLKQIEENIWKATTQQDAISIIQMTIQELEKIET